MKVRPAGSVGYNELEERANWKQPSPAARLAMDWLATSSFCWREPMALLRKSPKSLRAFWEEVDFVELSGGVNFVIWFTLVMGSIGIIISLKYRWFAG